MKDIQNIATSLFSKIRSRFSRVSLGDENAKATTDPEQAKFINFDFEIGGQNIGNITVSLVDTKSLKVYYGSNVTRNLNAQNKSEWFNFLKDLRQFAKMNMLSFDPRDIGRGSLQLNDIKNVASTGHAMRESKDVSPLTGSSKASQQSFGPVKILIKHKNKVDENVRGSRARNVESIYLENSEGERFKLPFTKLGGARAMARHLANGGQVYDDLGKKVVEMVNEMQDLAYFVRSSKSNESLNEDEELRGIVETATQHYYNLKRQMGSMKGQKGYQKFKEDNSDPSNGGAFNAPYSPDDSMSAMGGIKPDYESYTTTLKEKFTKKTFDERFDKALPHIAKVCANKKHHDEMSESSMKQWLKTPKISNTGDKFKKLTDHMKVKMEDKGDKSTIESKVFEFIELNEESDEIKSYTGTAKRWMEEGTEQRKTIALEFAKSYMKNLKPKKDPLKEYEDSLNDLVESTWSKPDNDVSIRELQAILEKPLPFGIDGNNASSRLYDILGDDELFDALYNDSKTLGAKADSRRTIEWFVRHNMPELLDQLDFSKVGSKDSGKKSSKSVSDVKKLAGLK